MTWKFIVANDVFKSSALFFLWLKNARKELGRAVTCAPQTQRLSSANGCQLTLLHQGQNLETEIVKMKSYTRLPTYLDFKIRMLKTPHSLAARQRNDTRTEPEVSSLLASFHSDGSFHVKQVRERSHQCTFQTGDKLAIKQSYLPNTWFLGGN